MADDESSTTSDESLDVKSEKFDPLKALYSSKTQLSSSRAPIYDNVSKFEAVMSGLSERIKVRIYTVRLAAESLRSRSFRCFRRRARRRARSKGNARGSGSYLVKVRIDRVYRFAQLPDDILRRRREE